MTDTEARIRIDFSQGELEIEGTESFVERHLDLIKELDAPFRKERNSSTVSDSREECRNPSSHLHVGSGLPEVPEYFGEWFHFFTHNDLTQVEEALIAGYYIQRCTEERDFSTSDIGEALDEVDVSLTNTSQSIKNLVNGDRAYKTHQENGKQYYKVSREGREYLQDLLEESDAS
jgi:hypothetical protein